MTTLNKRKYFVTARYVFGDDGGAVSPGVVPKQTSTIPQGAVITECFAEGIIVPTAGGNMKVSLGAVGGTRTDLTAVFTRAQSGAVAGSVTSGLLNNTLLPKKIAADSDIIFDASVAVTTQGEIQITIGYTL